MSNTEVDEVFALDGELAAAIVPVVTTVLPGKTTLVVRESMFGTGKVTEVHLSGSLTFAERAVWEFLQSLAGDHAKVDLSELINWYGKGGSYDVRSRLMVNAFAAAMGVTP